MTSTFMIQSVAYEIRPQISLVVDQEKSDSPSNPGSEAGAASNATTTTPQQAKNPRIQFLRLSSTASTARGLPGLTPPYIPAGPSLLRTVLDDESEHKVLVPVRNRSPLRSLVVSTYSASVNSRYDSGVENLHMHIDTHRYHKMPHAVSIPHSGFQALILCGPGIGLSTFTSVPSEFPKALINVANRPMVWYVLDWCYRMGVTDLTLITPPAAKDALRAALDQNPYLTSLPSPSPDLLAPKDLEFTTPTAELLRLPEVQKTIKSDFLLLPCDLICDISGDGFLETYLTSMGSLGGVSSLSSSGLGSSYPPNYTLGGEGSGRRGGLSIWYNTASREESVKGEECDFMGTAKLDSENSSLSQLHPDLSKGILRKLVWTMPMSELWDQVEENKGWKIRQSLMRKHGSVKCMTSYRDSHIYLFPYWVKEFAKMNEDFESASEDLVGTWAKAEWRKPSYRARFGASTIFGRRQQKAERLEERPIEEDIDLLSLSSTQVARPIPQPSHTMGAGVRLASRVQADPDDTVISPIDESPETLSHDGVPLVPPVLSYILPSSPDAPLVRRVDTTPLVLSVSLLLAKIPSIEEANANKVSASPFAHVSKVAGTVSIANRVTISRSDTLIDSNSSVATQCVIKGSTIGSSVSVGTGTRITNCVIMDGATIGDKCVLTGTVVGKKAKIGNGSTLQTCEVQDGNAVPARTEGKGEKYLVGGLEDDAGDDDFDYGDEDEEGEGTEI